MKQSQANIGRFDVIVIGAGPSGLCFAASLLATNLTIALIERQPRSVLERPSFDGRDIALTHASVSRLRRLGVWARVPATEISALKSARVLNGPSTYFMGLCHPSGADGDLGYLVSNHVIRRALYESLESHPRVSLFTDATVTGVRGDEDVAHVTLDGGRSGSASLVVAADNRFSSTRATMGIPAFVHDFGRTMMVFRVQHSKPHQQIAHEWFDYGQTVALLPLNGDSSSVVLTLRNHEVGQLKEMSTEDFTREIERRLGQRFGRIEVISERFSYPMVTVYPARFTAKRYAVIGDAAVGMHPVTAHGFNLGLRGATTLAHEIADAATHGEDIGSAGVLARYDRAHRRATLPWYVITNGIARLYTHEAAPARLARDVLLRLGNNMPPLRKMLMAALTSGASQ